MRTERCRCGVDIRRAMTLDGTEIVLNAYPEPIGARFVYIIRCDLIAVWSNRPQVQGYAAHQCGTEETP